MGPVEKRRYDRTTSVVFLKTTERFGGLSNMASGYPLHIQGVPIRTSEALYQACRFPHLPHIQQLIIRQASPMTAKMKSKPYRRDSRPDWDEIRVKVMRWCLRVKLAQNLPTFGSLLLRSGCSPIVEESRRDDFWGTKRVDEYILVGKNVLGRLLMELRETVQSVGREHLLRVEPPSIPYFLLCGRPITELSGGGIDTASTIESATSQDHQDSSYSGLLDAFVNQPIANQRPSTTYIFAPSEHSRMDRIKAYPAMMDSGVEWIGEVPKHWNVRRLKTVVHLTDRKVESDESHPLPYVGLDSIESWMGRLLPIKGDVVPMGIASEFKAGNTLFGKLRPYLAKACNPDFDGLCSTELLVLKSVHIDRRILLYLLLTDGLIGLVDSSTYGSKMPRASWDFVGSCLLPIALPDEQCAIANFLDRETSRLDTLVAKKRTLIERLKEKRTALISRTITRGLPPDAACAAGLDPHPSLKPSGIDWLGDVPEHWELAKLSRVTVSRCDGPFGSGLKSEHYTEGKGIRVVRLQNIRFAEFDDRDIAFIEPEYYRELGDHDVFAGDVLIAGLGDENNPVGRACVAPPALGPAMVKADCFRFRVDRRKVDAAYVALQLSATAYGLAGALASGTTRSRMNLSATATRVVAIPPLIEQISIVSFLSHETAEIDSLITKLETAIERLHEYRAALITEAVTGKIDVRGAVVPEEDAA